MIEKKSRTIRGRTIYIVLADCQIFGSWSNLKQLCIDMSIDNDFVSYSKISKEIATFRKNGNNTGKLDIATKDGKAYTIQIDILK